MAATVAGLLARPSSTLPTATDDGCRHLWAPSCLQDTRRLAARHRLPQLPLQITARLCLAVVLSSILEHCTLCWSLDGEHPGWATYALLLGTQHIVTACTGSPPMAVHFPFASKKVAPMHATHCHSRSNMQRREEWHHDGPWKWAIHRRTSMAAQSTGDISKDAIQYPLSVHSLR